MGAQVLRCGRFLTLCLLSASLQQRSKYLENQRVPCGERVAQEQAARCLGASLHTSIKLEHDQPLEHLGTWREGKSEEFES